MDRESFIRCARLTAEGNNPPVVIVWASQLCDMGATPDMVEFVAKLIDESYEQGKAQSPMRKT